MDAGSTAADADCAWATDSATEVASTANPDMIRMRRRMSSPRRVLESHPDPILAERASRGLQWIGGNAMRSACRCARRTLRSSQAGDQHDRENEGRRGAPDWTKASRPRARSPPSPSLPERSSARPRRSASDLNNDGKVDRAGREDRRREGEASDIESRRQGRALAKKAGKHEMVKDAAAGAAIGAVVASAPPRRRPRRRRDDRRDCGRRQESQVCGQSRRKNACKEIQIVVAERASLRGCSVCESCAASAPFICSQHGITPWARSSSRNSSARSGWFSAVAALRCSPRRFPDSG